MKEFFNKTRICFGKDALQYLKQYASLRCLLVADPFLVESGMIKQITGHLQEGNYRIFDHVVPDPPLELVIEGVKEIKEYEPDIMIAVGGGSAIDEAKAMAYFARRMGQESGRAEDCIEKESGMPAGRMSIEAHPNKKLTFFAIPTTSGTGSEVTSFAVITDTKKGIKYPLVSEELKPDVALLDPELVRSLPPSIVADTGMDVLTHALEAYVSTKANEFTDALAQKAVLLVFRYLVPSYESKENTEARAMMHYASCLAGLAFDGASLGLNHAIAHNIGARFHLPHGRTNAVLLPFVVEYNAQLLDYQQKEFSKAAEKYAALSLMTGLGGTNIRSAVKNLIHQIQKMQKQLKMPVTFRDCGISVTEYRKEEEVIIAGALQDSCILTNPRKTEESDIHIILKRAM